MTRKLTKIHRYRSWLLLLILLTSCVAPLPTGVAPAAPAEGAKIILRVGTGDSGEGLTPHHAIISAFEAANPDIQVHLEPVGSGDYYARILTQIATTAIPLWIAFALAALYLRLWQSGRSDRSGDCVDHSV